jgi:hypothetical protein
VELLPPLLAVFQKAFPRVNVVLRDLSQPPHTHVRLRADSIP